MSRILEALRQIESKRTTTPAAPSTTIGPAPAKSQNAPVVAPPRNAQTQDDPRLRFSNAFPTLRTPLPTIPVVAPEVTAPPVASAPVVPAHAITATKPAAPERAIAPSLPVFIERRRNFKSDAQLVGQFDHRWSVTQSAIAPLPVDRQFVQTSTVHVLALPEARTSQPIAPEKQQEPEKHAPHQLLRVVQPTGELAVKYGELVDQLLTELRQGANHVLTLAALSHAAHLAGVATNVGMLLAQKKLGPVLLVETPSDAAKMLSRSPAQSGRVGMRGLLEAMQGEPWGELIRRTPIEGLSILPAGVQPLDMEDASIAASLESLWAELRAEFRFVLVSVAPGKSAVSDMLACSTDRIYVAIELGATSLPETQATLRRWEELGGHPVGCIGLDG